MTRYVTLRRMHWKVNPLLATTITCSGATLVHVVVTGRAYFVEYLRFMLVSCANLTTSRFCYTGYMRIQ